MPFSDLTSCSSRCRQLLLQVRDRLVLEPGGPLQVAAALGVLELHLGLFDLLLEVLDLVDAAFLHLPLGGQLAVPLLQFGQLLLGFLEAILAGRVGLLLEGLPLDLELHDPPANAVQLGGQRVVLDPQLGGGLVDQVDGLVRQPAVGDVSVGQRRRRHQRRIGDSHAVMGLVAVLEAAKDGDGLLDARRVDQDRLEPALQRRILLDVLAVFVDRRGADAPQLAAGQRGLEQVARIDRALGLAGADDRVQLVDEQDDLPLGGDDLLEHRLEPVLELAAELRARDQRAHVQADDPLVLQAGRHVARDDPLGQALDDGRLADARLADQDGIVLGPPVEDLHAPPDLLVPPDHRIELALAGHLQQVDAVPLQGLVLLLRVLVGDLRAAADVLQRVLDLVRGDRIELEHLLGVALDGGQREQQVLDAEILVAHLVGAVLRIEHDLVERRIGHHLAGAGALGQSVQLVLGHLLCDRHWRRSS